MRRSMGATTPTGNGGSSADDQFDAASMTENDDSRMLGSPFKESGSILDTLASPFESHTISPLMESNITGGHRRSDFGLQQHLRSLSDDSNCQVRRLSIQNNQIFEQKLPINCADEYHSFNHPQQQQRNIPIHVDQEMINREHASIIEELGRIIDYCSNSTTYR